MRAEARAKNTLRIDVAERSAGRVHNILNRIAFRPQAISGELGARLSNGQHSAQ